MDIKMRELLITLATFLLGFVAESRVLYSNNNGDMVADSASYARVGGGGRKSHKNFDRAFKSGHNNTTSMSSRNYNEVNSSPWDVENYLGGDGGDLSNSQPKTEFGQILYSLREMSSELQELRTAVGNLKYQNHVIYKQLKRVNSKCLANSVPMANGIVAEERRLCPKEYTWNSDFGKCYKFSSNRITWRMANERCMLQDSQLLAIESQREMSFVTEMARKSKDLRHCDFWAGGEREKTDSQWRWTATKKPMTYTHWNHNEPNNGAGHEHCLQMLWVFGWRWNDARCNSVNACFICQKEIKEIF